MLTPRVMIALILSMITLLLVTLTIGMLAQPLKHFQAGCEGISMLQRANAWLQGVRIDTTHPLAGLSKTDREVEERVCPPRIIHASPRTPEQTVVRLIADEMVRCWTLHGMGRVNYAPNAAGNMNYCMPCTYITLEKDIHGLNEYLYTQTLPGRRITYAEYILGESQGESVNIRREEDTLPAGRYVLLFYQDVKGDWWRILTSGQTTEIPVDVGVKGSFGSAAGAIIRKLGYRALTSSGRALGFIGKRLGLVGFIVVTSASFAGDVYASTHPTRATSSLLLIRLDENTLQNDTQCAQLVHDSNPEGGEEKK